MFIFVVEVGYNLILHKIQSQKLIFLVFSSYFSMPHAQNLTSIIKTNTPLDNIIVESRRTICIYRLHKSTRKIHLKNK
jgi:hypothetical protein